MTDYDDAGLDEGARWRLRNVRYFECERAARQVVGSMCGKTDCTEACVCAVAGDILQDTRPCVHWICAGKTGLCVHPKDAICGAWPSVKDCLSGECPGMEEAWRAALAIAESKVPK